MNYRQGAQMGPDGGQRFTVRVEVSEAQAVYVLGPFNNWSTTATPMRRVSDGAWEIVLPEPHAMMRLSFFVWRQGQRGGRLLCGSQSARREVATHRASRVEQTARRRALKATA